MIIFEIYLFQTLHSRVERRLTDKALGCDIERVLLGGRDDHTPIVGQDRHTAIFQVQQALKKHPGAIGPEEIPIWEFNPGYAANYLEAHRAGFMVLLFN